MKTIFICVVAFLVPLSIIKGQNDIIYDKIIYKDKSSIECKVLKVTSNTVEIDPSGDIPFLIIDREKINYIIYSDNTVVNFQIDNNKDNNPNISINDPSYVSWRNCSTGAVYYESMPGSGFGFSVDGISFPEIGTRGSFYLKNKLEIKGCKDSTRLIVNYEIKFNFDEKNWVLVNYIDNLVLIVNITYKNETIFKKTQAVPNTIEITKRTGYDLQIGSFEFHEQNFNISLSFSKVVLSKYQQFYNRFTTRFKVGTEDWLHWSEIKPLI
ncbi:MAG: hypothetical protein JXB49_14175 [Bacteroidales bacterium]|nr:hypothetical protein [Bacteroidales bacterium]